jgi:hypothetical protein
MVPRVERKAAKKNKKAQKKAARPKPSQRVAKKKAKKKAAPKKTTKKTTRKTTTVPGRTSTGKPISKPPKLDMNSDVMEFIAAIDAYRKEYHRPFPGWSEILFVVKNLGYRKADD